MSKSSRGRLSKNDYLKLKEQFTSTFCHKSKCIYRPKPMSYISYYSNKDFIVCVCCGKEMVNKITYSGRYKSTSENCCYDCEFSYFCDKCCFTYTRNYVYEDNFNTCGISFMKQLINPNYGGGRYSDLSIAIIEKLKFEKDIKYAKRYGLNKNILKGKKYM